MTSNDSSLVSSSDSKVSGIKDYESEVKGLGNSNDQATHVEETKEAYVDEWLADAQ